jgi:Flp pilus assembly protein TadG
LIEYAMLAPVFFLLVIGLIEFVLYQYKAYALGYVTYEAARVLQTGQVQTSADMSKAFHDQVCASSGLMLDCESIQFDVRSFDNVSDVTYPPPEFDKDGKPVNFVFEPGGANKYSVVRSSIRHDFVTPFMADLFDMKDSNNKNITAIVNSYCIVKNEPWA